jgi:hypothetical protein
MAFSCPTYKRDGETLYRLAYDSTAQGAIHFHADSFCAGNPDPHNYIPPCSVVVDFNQAANSPVCRNVDRSGATQLGVMSWNIGGESGTWCMEPLVPLAAHVQPDYNGHWSADNDGGWGFELLDVALSSGPIVVAYVYYPGPGGQPTWATGSGTLNNGTLTMNLQQVTNGFCRSCTPPSGGLTGASIGSMTISLNSIVSGQRPSGRVSIQANYPGGSFSRASEPMKMLSVPTGQ